ncbi:MAG: PEP-CTERM sorting domain-containing protein [Verrucomicrobiia bacterium]
MRGDGQTPFVCDGPVCKTRPAARHIRSWITTALAALSGVMVLLSTSAFGQLAYAMQFNQANNQFGTINLVTGGFTQLGTEGGTLFNDIAAAANGRLYGIVNTASLVTLNINNGAVLSSVNFNVGGIESLAIASDGTLYGATQGALYKINPVSGVATLVGSFNNSVIGNSGQNIRFGYDGMLYDTDGGVNATSTQLFQISTSNGSATLMGTVTNFPGLCLENAGSQLYGVGIQVGAASTLRQDLVGINLSTIRAGGTNLDGSTLDIGYQLLTSNFPNNYNFSSANTFVVQGSTYPVPEPSVTVLSLTGGMLLLMVSSKRHRR